MLHAPNNRIGFARYARRASKPLCGSSAGHAERCALRGGDVWNDLLGVFGGTAAILALLGFLFRSIVNQLLSKDIEVFKTKLKADADATLASMSNDLKLAVIEHEVRFSSMHQRRAEVIAETYRLLAEALACVQSFVSPMEWLGEPDKKEKYKTAMQALGELFRYFDRNRIYLPERLCQSIDAFVDGLREPTIRFSVYLGVSEHDSEGLKERTKAWQGAWEKVESSAPLARRALEEEFREILGAEDNSAQQGAAADAAKPRG